MTRAVASPPALFLTTLGGILVLSPELWPAGLAALAADAGYLWWRIRDPRHALTCSDQMQRGRWRALITRIEELSAGLDAGTAAALQAIVESQERLLALYGTERALLPSTRLEWTSLLEHCLALAEKRLELQTYLATFNEQDILRERSHLQVRLDAAQDDETRSLYQQALDQKQQELANRRQLEASISRIDGQLTVVRCTFDNVLSRVIRMNSVDARQVQPETDPVFQELNQLTTRVAQLEDSLNETLTLNSAA